MAEIVPPQQTPNGRSIDVGHPDTPSAARAAGAGTVEAKMADMKALAELNAGLPALLGLPAAEKRDRANYTRGFIANNAHWTYGQLRDALTRAGVEAGNIQYDNDKCISAIYSLQKSVLNFPDEDCDAMFGQKTFAALKEYLARQTDPPPATAATNDTLSEPARQTRRVWLPDSPLITFDESPPIVHEDTSPTPEKPEPEERSSDYATFIRLQQLRNQVASLDLPDRVTPENEYEVQGKINEQVDAALQCYAEIGSNAPSRITRENAYDREKRHTYAQYVGVSLNSRWDQILSRVQEATS